MKKNFKGFTLIEILLGILIFSIVILGGFQALSAVNIGKIKLLEKTNITKDVVYFSEKLFEEIKAGGTIDYEEYFNRKVVGTTTLSGHYNLNTGFGNFGNNGNPSSSTYGNGFYFCRSGDGVFMGTGGCFNTPTFNSLGADSGPQRYGQYAFQFIDFNSNLNNDTANCGAGFELGDEDCNGNIRGDDDDENLGFGPIVFTGGENVKEIYLISGDGKKRTFFRWSWKQDPKNPSGANCDGVNFGSGCLGTIEMLKLDGKDWGVDHTLTPTSTGSFDGIIDTWLIDEKFGTGAQDIAGSNNYNYRQPLFPDTVNVSDFKVFMYPNISSKNAWKDNTNTSNINPYLRLSLTLEPSWKKRASMKGEIPKYTINTTINLVDYFTK